MSFLDYLIGKKPSSESQPKKLQYSYEGGTVTDGKLIETLRFLTDLELLWQDAKGNPEEAIAKTRKLYRPEINMANQALRTYGLQIMPPTLDELRREYNSLLELEGISDSYLQKSAIAASLNYAWNGINGWQS